VGSEAAKLLVLGLLGMVSVMLANRTVAIYHDGLRTSVIELWTGEKTRRELAAYAWSISIGFIVAYALPYSLATGILMIHIICLGADIIGMRIANLPLAGAVGFLYGVVATGAVDLFVAGMRHLPPALPNVHLLFLPLGYTFPLLAAVAAGQQFGFRWGSAASGLTLALWGLANWLLHTVAGGTNTVFSSGLLALAAVTAILVAVAWRVKGSSSSDLTFFEDKIRRIRGNWVYLLPVAALIALAGSRGWLGGEPIQIVMLNLDQRQAAAMVAAFSVIGFIPVQGMTGLVSGVWNQDGYPDWFLGAGYLIANPILAALAGVALMGVELLSLRWVARLLTTRPGMTSLGHAARDAMDTVPNLSILAGGVIAAVATAGPAGAFVIVAAYALNDLKGRPVVPLAVPVLAYLVVALFAGLGRRAGLLG
jgi:Protein of unknown function